MSTDNLHFFLNFFYKRIATSYKVLDS